MVNEESNTGVNRIRRVSRNFFLHIHSPKIHPAVLNPAYTFGLGLILGFLFLIMIITGFILMMNYTPSVDRAYDSVKDIMFIVPGGRYIRNIHRWAAHGMVLVTFLHLIRTFLTGTYYGTRRLNWVIGVVMFVVVLFMSFSGYLLPWDQLAYWAVTIGSNIAASARELTDILGITSVVDIGGFFKKLLIGGETVGQTSLTRFFMLHVIFLPISLLVLTAFHFWRIRRDGGLSIGVRSSDSEKLYSWPVLMWIELATLLVVVVILLSVSFFADAPLMEQANPSFPENPAKSPWYFLGIQELVSYSAFIGGLLIPLSFVAFLISIPYVDKENDYKGSWFSGAPGKRTLLFSISFSLVTTITLISVVINLGWFRDWFGNLPVIINMLINPATLLALIYMSWAIIIRRKTGSTRMAAIALFACAMIGLIIFTVIGIWFRGPNWEFYWSASQWPVQ
ncbi:MAG: cytochrome b N-terminal domain-containing protein [Bacteroidales bacterium]|nr:cytochrome b N-terminal domain-containing protein [Bacteroidales bacterium]